MVFGLTWKIQNKIIVRFVHCSVSMRVFCNIAGVIMCLFELVSWLIVQRYQDQT
jgi:hypothetical protein